MTHCLPEAEFTVTQLQQIRDNSASLTFHYLWGRGGNSVLLPTETWYRSSLVPGVSLRVCWIGVNGFSMVSCSALLTATLSPRKEGKEVNGEISLSPPLH